MVKNKLIKDFSDCEWLNYYVGDGGRYVQSIFDPVQNYALYGLTAHDIDRYKDILKNELKANKFRTVSTKYQYKILCFNYEKSKDTARKEALEYEDENIKKEAAAFAERVANTDTSKYSPKASDIAKMKGYMEKGSKPDRLKNSIKDNDKLIRRWLAAKILGWDEADHTFSVYISAYGLLTKEEIAAYSQKYTKKEAEQMVDAAESYTPISLKNYILENING